MSLDLDNLLVWRDKEYVGDHRLQRTVGLVKLRTVADSKIPRDGLPLGTLAPDFALPLVGGGEITLSGFRGTDVFLIFADPHCGPCDALAPMLQQLYIRSRTIKVLVVSRGSSAENSIKLKRRALTFPVALQNAWNISRQYATFATPSGYLIDYKGRTVTEVLIGLQALVEQAEKICMREYIGDRLVVLRKELDKGQIELDAVERQRKYLQETMLRISGAVRALEELLSEGGLETQLLTESLLPDIDSQSGQTAPSRIENGMTDPTDPRSGPQIREPVTEHIDTKS